MKNDFSERLRRIELELTALKTASLYTSVRSSHTAYSGRIQTGLYLITYDNDGEGILSFFFIDKRAYYSAGHVYPRTPIGSTQIVEVNTTYVSTQPGSGTTTITYDLAFVVVSNVPVVSITRVS